MRILIIEDDLILCDSLKYQLEHEGISVDICHDGDSGLRYIRENIHDLILLDRMLPILDGTAVLKKIRGEQISTPLILVTALGDLHDRVQGLDLGADDYIVKPFAFEELMARIRCISRRPSGWNESKPLIYGDISYDASQKKLARGDQTCALSRREGDLLEAFLQNFGKILPRMTLLTRVWGPDASVEEGNLDNYIHLLRRRLTSVGSTLSLKTIRGIGYCLEDTNV